MQPPPTNRPTPQRTRSSMSNENVKCQPGMEYDDWPAKNPGNGSIKILPHINKSGLGQMCRVTLYIYSQSVQEEYLRFGEETMSVSDQ